MYDVVTLGEAMLRLSPSGFQRLEQAESLEMKVGGAELNVAVSASRLGLRSAWVSKVPNSPLGRLMVNKAREQGVDTSHVLWTDKERAGIYFVEFGSTPRAAAVYYDRKHSAASTLKPGDVDWGGILGGAKVFHTSGITPALSPSCREATLEAFQAARQSGCLTSFDLNFRAKLWSAEEARSCFEKILGLVDILITTQYDTEEVLGFSGDYGEIARKLAERFNIPVVAITVRGVKTVLTGTWTSLVYADGRLFTDEVSEIEIVDRFGAGDSFSAGFLYGYLHGGIEEGLKIGDAMATIKHSIPGDFALITMEEVQKYLKSRDFRVQR